MMAASRTSTLARASNAPGAARRLLGEWLDEHRCARREDALFVISELVTNAVVHADGDRDPVVVFALADGWVRLEVHDGDPTPPERRTPHVNPPGGYGLNIVDQLCEEWGWSPSDEGKIVWCHIAC